MIRPDGAISWSCRFHIGATGNAHCDSLDGILTENHSVGGSIPPLGTTLK